MRKCELIQKNLDWMIKLYVAGDGHPEQEPFTAGPVSPAQMDRDKADRGFRGRRAVRVLSSGYLLPAQGEPGFTVSFRISVNNRRHPCTGELDLWGNRYMMDLLGAVVQ